LEEKSSRFTESGWLAASSPSVGRPKSREYLDDDASAVAAVFA
jgi:hypothetical protein